MKKLLTILCLVLLVSLSTEVSFSQSNQEDCDFLCQLGQSQSTQTPKENARYKEYTETISWSGLNLEAGIKIKHIDSRVHYIVILRDQDHPKVSIEDTDYYPRLNDDRTKINFNFGDRDGFYLYELVINLSDKVNVFDANDKITELEFRGNFSLEKDTYNSIQRVRAITFIPY